MQIELDMGHNMNRSWIFTESAIIGLISVSSVYDDKSSV